MDKVTMADLFSIETVATPAYHPDGSCFLYVTNRICERENVYRSRIMLYNSETGTQESLVSHPSKNTLPVWNAAGNSFLFISNRTGTNQVYVFDVDSREEKQLTFEEADVAQVAWHVDDVHFFYGTERTERSSFIADNVFVTRRLDYLSNGKGLLSDDRRQVVVMQHIDEKQGREVCTYSLGYGLKKAWTVVPDGSALIVEKPADEADPFNQDTLLFKVDLTDFSETLLLPEISAGCFGEPTWSDNQRYLAAVGSDKPYQTINQFCVFLYDTANRTLQNMTGRFDCQVSDFAVSDIKAGESNPLLQWSPADQCFYTLVSLEGRVSIFKLVPDTGVFEELTPGAHHITDFTVHPSEKELLFCESTPGVPSRIVRLHTESGEKHVLVDPNKPLAEMATADYQPVEYRAKDGGRIPGYLVLPSDNKTAKIPLIVNIHGGPYTMHATTFHHEVQMMAGAGYAVLLVNPRGSFGYGQQHLDGVLGRYGEEDYTDMMTAVHEVLAEYKMLDADNLFVTGGSYGGFMVNWMICHSDMFKAAVTQRSMSNFVSMVGTSDIGYHFFVEENKADILKADILWQKSPLAYVAQVNTPVLIMHSEQDDRCPMEQAEQWYAALKYLGKDAAFIRFDQSDHDLSRSGLPQLRRIRLEEMMKWFAFYRNS